MRAAPRGEAFGALSERDMGFPAGGGAERRRVGVRCLHVAALRRQVFDDSFSSERLAEQREIVAHNDGVT